MTDPLRRELRDELARAINKTRPPTCDHPQCSCTYECERHDDMADSYLDAVDAMTPILTRELAAAIEALRADLREMTALRDKWADATLAAEARVKALEGVLDKYRAGIVTHVQMNGPVFGGANSRQLKIAFEADQALAAGGGNG